MSRAKNVKSNVRFVKIESNVQSGCFEDISVAWRRGVARSKWEHRHKCLADALMRLWVFICCEKKQKPGCLCLNYGFAARPLSTLCLFLPLTHSDNLLLFPTCVNAQRWPSICGFFPTFYACVGVFVGYLLSVGVAQDVASHYVDEVGLWVDFTHEATQSPPEPEAKTNTITLALSPSMLFSTAATE